MKVKTWQELPKKWQDELLDRLRNDAKYMLYDAESCASSAKKAPKGSRWHNNLNRRERALRAKALTLSSAIVALLNLRNPPQCGWEPET